MAVSARVSSDQELEQAHGQEPAPEARVDLDLRLVEACRQPSARLGVHSLRSIGVTSALRGEGRTSIALAVAVIQSMDYGRRTAVIEADFDNPSLARRLNLRASPGLAELIRGEATVADCIQSVGRNLSVVTAGSVNGEQARLLAGLGRQRVVDSIQMVSEIVVADLSPALDCPSGRVPSESFQRLLMVVRAGVTPLSKVEEAVRGIGSRPALLLNGTQTRLPRWLRALTGG